ncbi:hypothetical protein AGDE_05772 [Angomonas deanei]|nr:hypothetical protein AGDE_05772 [Angomonas deanei]|eukprot:EPY38159.1 hypothetical protein AGDE_05772 [Angomonas deanei]
MSHYRPGEYDIRYTVTPYPDHIKHRPFLEVGEPRQIPLVKIPVLFLVNLFNEEKGVWFGKKHETVYVSRDFAREELIPQRYAIYATEEAYRAVGLPVIRHAIHEEIPKTAHDYKKLLEKQSYNEERWKYSVEYLFRRYEAGPPQLLDKSEDDWDGVEELAASEGGAGGSGDQVAKRKGPIKQRKARKIKLF